MKRDLNDIICHCEQVTYEEILKAIQSGAKTVDEISDQTNAAIACGYCIETIEEIVEEEL